ncbi:MAG: ribonuclease H family protein [Bacteroidaceae bacterium]|nr:ribonuclease H family protein [Bacteroidaceae bacterium]MBP5731298.1 ribonuclease H family protein [Bacteroidaceae bacterium]
MSKQKPKYYVVWQGREPGIYLTWDECKAQVHGAEGARYKSFPTMEEAEKAFADGAPPIERKAKNPELRINNSDFSNEIIQDAYAVDAACSGNPGMMEYRGVDVKSGIQLFHFGPIMATNNIGEFLAIVHALALQKQQGTAYPIYSDSRNALLWIKARQCRTKLELNDKTAKAHELIARAEKWLNNNDYSEFKILKWNTDRWGEIPADFGRK